MAKYNVCTNFYSNYLYKGLTLYYSLHKTSKDFCLWILCMDEETYMNLSKLKMKHAKLIKLESVETSELLKLKSKRDKAEYSWTLKSSFMNNLFDRHPKMKSLLYLDADIFFFRDIKLVYKEIGNNSIAVTPHRFPVKYSARVVVSGKYNAGVVYIKRDKIGLKALDKWRRQCINWCHRIPENGKFGDQTYLDEWPKLYNNLHQFRHPGINLAPWNIGEYNIYKKSHYIYIDGKPLIFYHFHELKIYSNLSFTPSCGYSISKRNLTTIYKPYEKAVLNTIKLTNQINPKLKLALEKRSLPKDVTQSVKRFLLPIYWKYKTLSSNKEYI